MGGWGAVTGTRIEKILSREWALALLESWGFKGLILPFCSFLSYFIALNSFPFFGSYFRKLFLAPNQLP